MLLALGLNTSLIAEQRPLSNSEVNEIISIVEGLEKDKISLDLLNIEYKSYIEDLEKLNKALKQESIILEKKTKLKNLRKLNHL